ncbi:hypothetical protein JL720_11969 [Aureococcus anophagefferens]|nr:hypothetical protein JL720_11969 [Aureococcus anophagefferens]
MVEKKPAPAAASAKTVGDGTNRLRMTRTATLFALTTLLYFGSIIFYGASRATTPAERYVTGGDALYVEVAGCDVRVESGPRSEVDVERWIWHWAEVRWFYRSGGAKVWKVIVRNVVGCHNAPFFESDPADHLTVRVENVALASLDVSGNFDVSLKGVAVAGAAKISTTDGSVAIADSDLGQGGGSCRVKSTRGSVAIAESRDVVDDLAVAYRSRHYDGDANGYVTQAEFKAGVDALGACLGSGCPRYSSASSAAAVVFDAGDGTLLTQMAASSLGSALGDANYTELAPYAYRHLAATRANRTDGMGDAVNGTRYVAPAEGTLPGVHLLEKDVVKLQKIAKRYGAFLARSDVFAVIDALSFEVIRPRVARYRVRLTNGDACSAAGVSDADVRGQVYEELAKILTPSGQPYLKGQLVRVRKRNALLDRPRLDAYAYADGAYASADFSRTVMRGRGWHAFYASIALAFFATLYALDDAEDGKTGAFKEAADDADAAAQREEQEEASALAKEAAAAEAELKQLGVARAVVADDEEGDGGDLQDWGGIMTWAEGLVLKDVVFLLDLVKPLMRPLATVDTAVVTPLRRSLIDARAKFVRMRCVLDADALRARGKSGKVAPADESPRRDLRRRPSRTCFRTFVHAHTDFCFKKNLSDAGVDRPSLQRYLVATHDLRFKVHRMPKVRGRAWKKAWIPATKRSRKPFVSHGTIFAQGAAFFEGLEDVAPAAATSQDAAAVRAFLAERTEPAAAKADGDRVLRICSEPVVLGDGALGRRKGLVGEFNAHRRDAGLPAVDLREHLGWLADEFDLAVETEMKLSVDGLRLRNFAAGGKKLKLSGSFYVEHVLTAVAHFACLVVPIVLLCSVAMHLQLRHSKLWAAVVGDGAERFWSIYDATLVEDFVLSGDARVFASAFVAAYAGLYFLAAVARVYFHYAGDGIYYLPPAPERLVSCVRLVFAVLCVGAAFLVLFYAFLVAVWLLAGAILDPAKLSSRSVAFFTLCTSISALRQQLAAAAEKHENLIYERLRSRVAEALESYSKAREATQKRRLFAALDGNNSGGVTADEIRELAAVAALPELDDAKLAQIFAYADADLDAVVDADEFDRAWTWVERQIVDASLERAGLGPRFVNAAVAGAAVLLAGAFVFLFLVFAAWSEGSTFAACVESLLVLSAGFAVRGLGPSAAAVMPEAVVRRGGGAKKAV